MSDRQCPTDHHVSKRDVEVKKATENLTHLTQGLAQEWRSDEFGTLGDEFRSTRTAFINLYQSLIEAGHKPELSGALHPPEHPRVDLMPNGDVFGTYDDLGTYLQACELSMSRKMSKETGVMGFERHHLIEDHWLQEFGFSKEEAPCVATYADEHMGLAHGQEGIGTELPRVVTLDGETTRGLLYGIEELVE